jgi:hypothetical protein
VNTSLAVVRSVSGFSQPDIGWIRKNVPVLKVAMALGMRVRHQKAKCWRPERHANRDAHPSLCFSQRRNRVRCMVCDMRGGHSCIDLVAGVLGIDTGSAVRWIAKRFPVPNVKAGRPLGNGSKCPAPYHVGLHASPFEVFVRSGMFGELPAAERSILIALEVFKDPESGTTCLSYQAIQRYAGVSSRTTVSKALKRLHQIHAIQISRGARIGITRACSTYRVTLEEEKFLSRCYETFSRDREQIAKEREYRKELRSAREKQARHDRTLNMNTAGGLRVPRTPALILPNSSKTNQEKQREEPNLKVQNLSTPSGQHVNKPVHASYRLIGVSPSGSPERRLSRDRPCSWQGNRVSSF